LSWNLSGTIAQPGDLAGLVGLNHKHFIIKLVPGAEFQTHRGVIQHDQIIGLKWGSKIRSHNNSPFIILQPSLADLLRQIKRNTQIIYPKDIGYILVRLGIGPGMKVLEAGTGSGALTTAMAFAVGKEGRIYTYESREEMMILAKKNLEKVELQDRVEFKLHDIRNGFFETDMDAAFLDVQNPHDFIRQIRTALKPGGFFGTILPTTNQVIRLLEALRQEKFAFVDVCEIMMRFYKAESDHFRPTDRMVAHTGYLIFARPVNYEQDENEDLLNEAFEAED
jgi:tRNA (adenine57-N1/adenine58-N1)-methyltransferase